MYTRKWRHVTLAGFIIPAQVSRQKRCINFIVTKRQLAIVLQKFRCQALKGNIGTIPPLVAVRFLMHSVGPVIGWCLFARGLFLAVGIARLRLCVRRFGSYIIVNCGDPHVVPTARQSELRIGITLCRLSKKPSISCIRFIERWLLFWMNQMCWN